MISTGGVFLAGAVGPEKLCRAVLAYYKIPKHTTLDTVRRNRRTQKVQ